MMNGWNASVRRSTCEGGGSGQGPAKCVENTRELVRRWMDKREENLMVVSGGSVAGVLGVAMRSVRLL